MPIVPIDALQEAVKVKNTKIVEMLFNRALADKEMEDSEMKAENDANGDQQGKEETRNDHGDGNGDAKTIGNKLEKVKQIKDQVREAISKRENAILRDRFEVSDWNQWLDDNRVWLGERLKEKISSHLQVLGWIESTA